MMIAYNEIQIILKDSYKKDNDKIITKHNPFNGEREFALALIEQCMGLLSQCEVNKCEVNDCLIIQFMQGILALTESASNHYEEYLNSYASSSFLMSSALSGEKLSLYDIVVIKELMKANIGEYTTKGEYQSCCYSAMLAFFQTAYCVMEKRINFNVKHIDMVADLDDELVSIQLFESTIPTDIITLSWHSSNKINSMYMLYKNQYAGLDKMSILDLVSADVIEEEYYFKDERFSIAPSILTKQYCAIIEHEVNEIIQLLSLPNKPDKHLMWNDIKKYVSDNNIDLDVTSFSLMDVLEDLHKLRNKGAHGEVVTKEEYKVITHYKNLGLFGGISIKKLVLKNGKISPTIDEINEYFGLT